jgi:UPF0755 protein
MGENLRKNRLFICLLVFFSLALAIGGSTYIAIHHILNLPSQNHNPVYYYLPKGSGLIKASYQAENMDLVSDEKIFRYAVIYLGLETKLRSGEYEILPGTPLKHIIKKIADGDIFYRKVSIPEGYSNKQTLEVLKNSFGINLTKPFNDQDLIEGTLLPETYLYERGDSITSLVARMQKGMTRTIQQYWSTRAEGLPFDSPDQALVLASIVEKETALSSERPLVAAVFLNRLKRNMRLQSDPTIIYGITGGLPLGRAITRKDIQTKTLYNTYQIKGLPPTAIANPGIDAIKAVLHPPTDNKYLYFVADGSGGHAFAETLVEHNKNVAKWRAIERARKQ